MYKALKIVAALLETSDEEMDLFGPDAEQPRQPDLPGADFDRDDPANADPIAFLDYVNSRLFPRICTTYDVITPESAENGDYAESGWNDEEGEPCDPNEQDLEDGLDAADIAASWLEDKGPLKSTSSRFHVGVSYCTLDPERDHDGETYYTYHLKDFTPDQEEKVFNILHGSNVLL